MSPALPLLSLGPMSMSDRGAERRVVEAHHAAYAPKRRRTAAVMGADDPQLCALFGDVLRDNGIDVKPVSAEEMSPDVVLAMVDRVSGVKSVSEARTRFKGAPVVAILPLGTHRLATRAIAVGAQGCYMLDMPIDRLRGLLLALLSDAPQPATSRRR